MIKVITKYEEIDKAQWNELLYNRSAVASFFQSPEAYELYEPFDWAESVVLAVEEDGILTGVVVATLQHEGHGLMRHLTSRAIINGGPLLDNAITKEALTALLTTTINILKKRSVYIETRNFNDYSRWRTIFENCVFKYQPHYNFHIDTSTPQTAWERFQKSRRRTIRRALEAGVCIEEWKEGDNSIITFYNILSNLYKTKIHTPLPPLKFFLELGSKPFGKIFLIHTSDNQVIGGQVCVLLESRAIYAWYCCGMDKVFPQYHPSVMANYSGIKYATDNSIPMFDMMGAGSPDDGGYGVRDFKAQFGGQLVEHGRFLYLCRPLIYKTAKLALRIRKKL